VQQFFSTRINCLWPPSVAPRDENQLALSEDRVQDDKKMSCLRIRSFGMDAMWFSKWELRFGEGRSIPFLLCGQLQSNLVCMQETCRSVYKMWTVYLYTTSNHMCAFICAASMYYLKQIHADSIL
jgi:hypothetical protein